MHIMNEGMATVVMRLSWISAKSREIVEMNVIQKKDYLHDSTFYKEVKI